MGLFGGSKAKIVVSTQYSMGILMGLCVGKRNPADLLELRKIYVDDRLAWSGSKTTYDSLSINQPDLFGGYKNEGGIQGLVRVMPGEADQPKNGYLVQKLGALVPAFRGLLCLVLEKVYLTANNPYIKPWAPEIRYIFQAWYAAKAAINTTQANPAHIVYECITNPDWGMGYPASQIDSPSFVAAADTLYDESFGLSFAWVDTESLQDFVQRVVDHIAGVLITDPLTGKFQLTLIRNDYTPATLPIFGPSNAQLDSYERQGWGETVNEVTVVYIDPDQDKEVSVTVHDLGNIQAQGVVVPQENQYLGIHDHNLAYRVAMRDLKAGCSPLAKISMKVNREAWSLRPGDVFKLTWPKLGVTEQIFRAAKVDTGTLTDGTIRIEAIEDVFSLPLNTYGDIQPPEWVSPNSAPVPALFRKVFEMPYWYIAQALGDTDAQATPDAAGYLMTLAVQPVGDALEYVLLAKVGANDYDKEDNVSWNPIAQLADNVSETVTTLLISELSNMGSAAVGMFLLGDEFVEVINIDLVAGQLTVNRGINDTVPVTHPIGTLIYAIGDDLGSSSTQFFDTEQVDAKMLTITSLGQLEEASAPADSVVMNERQVRPYPPGKVELNGEYFPAQITGELTVSWVHRDRLLQTSETLITQDDPSVGPEAGTTYTIRVYGQPDFPGGPQPLIKTQSGETGTSWTYPEADEKADSGLGHLNSLLRVEVEAVRDGFVSWTFWAVTTSREIVTTDIDINQVTVPGDTDLALG